MLPSMPRLWPPPSPPSRRPRSSSRSRRRRRKPRSRRSPPHARTRRHSFRASVAAAGGWAATIPTSLARCRARRRPHARTACRHRPCHPRSSPSMRKGGAAAAARRGAPPCRPCLLPARLATAWLPGVPCPRPLQAWGVQEAWACPLAWAARRWVAACLGRMPAGRMRRSSSNRSVASQQAAPAATPSSEIAGAAGGFLAAIVDERRRASANV